MEESVRAYRWEEASHLLGEAFNQVGGELGPVVGHGAVGLVGEVISPDPPKIHGAAAGSDLHFVGVHALGAEAPWRRSLASRRSDEQPQREARLQTWEAGWAAEAAEQRNFAGFERAVAGGDRGKAAETEERLDISDRLVGSKPESVYMGHNCSSQSGRDRGTPRALDISDRIGF